MDQHQQTVTSILPSSVPVGLEQSYYGPSSTHQRASQERSVNRGDDPHDQARLERAVGLFKQTEASFIANYNRHRFRALITGDKEDRNGTKLPRILAQSYKLWMHLWDCKQFRDYRMRQPKDAEQAYVSMNDDDSKKVTWPDIMEVAFWRALAAYRPMGRCKVSMQNDAKQRGRNELIAEFIMVETGRHCRRKQISSHIQVLRPYVMHDDFIMSFITAPPGELAQRQNRRRHRPPISRPRRHSNAYMPSSRHHLSKYPVNKYQNWSQLPLTYTSMGSNVFRSHYTGYTLENFSMRIQEPDIEGGGRVFHEFTSLRKIAQLSSITITEFKQLMTDYHQLGSFSANELLNTQIIAAEATIRLVCRKHPSGAELGILLSFNTPPGLDKYKDLQCRVRFFDQGKLIKFKMTPKDRHNSVSSEPYEGTEVCDSVFYSPDQRVGMHFGSDFWAHRLGMSMSSLKRANEYLAKAMELKEEDAAPYETAAKDLKTQLVQSFKDLTALQEVSGIAKNTGKHEKLLLVCWRFEQCIDESRPGETTWRNIIVNQTATHAATHATTHAAAGAVSSDLPYPTPHLKNESVGSNKWEHGHTNNQVSKIGLSLQQPYDSTSAYVLSDFSTMGMDGMSASVSIEDQLAPQMYTDNDFDFNSGHIQLNIGSVLSQVPVTLDGGFSQDIDGLAGAGLLYDPTSNWQSYPDPYFIQTESAGYGDSAQAYDEHEDAAFSEAGAQQHNDTSMNFVVPQEHRSFTEPLQPHLFSPPDPGVVQSLSAEEALRQQIYHDGIHAQTLSPRHEDSVAEQVMQSHESDVPRVTGDLDGYGSDHALQSIEFGSQDIAV